MISVGHILVAGNVEKPLLGVDEAFSFFGPMVCIQSTGSQKKAADGKLNIKVIWRERRVR